MLHDARRKMELLILEVRGARAFGPSGQLATALQRQDAKVTMYDATSLSREVSPELALHFSRVQQKAGPQYHVLEYVTIRFTGEYVLATEAALDSWLQANGGVRREMQVRSAIDVLRQSVANLNSPDGKKRASRHLRLISQELISS